MDIKKMTKSSLLIALGVVTGSLICIPIGIAKCFPIQHLINILSVVLLGPVYGVVNAFVISILRNILGFGSLLAFPGSMIGALLAGLLYKKTKQIGGAAIGELVGTGLIGALVGVPVAILLMGKPVGALTFIIPFFFSSLSGVVISMIMLQLPVFKKMVKENE